MSFFLVFLEALVVTIRRRILRSVEALLNGCAFRLLHASEALSSAADAVGGKA